MKVPAWITIICILIVTVAFLFNFVLAKNWIGSKKFQVFVKRTKSDRACRKSIYMLYFFMFFQERNLKVGRKEKK